MGDLDKRMSVRGPPEGEGAPHKPQMMDGIRMSQKPVEGEYRGCRELLEFHRCETEMIW